VLERASVVLPGCTFSAFPMNSPGFTSVSNAAGKLEFRFTVPDNTAFKRQKDLVRILVR